MTNQNEIADLLAECQVLLKMKGSKNLPTVRAILKRAELELREVPTVNRYRQAFKELRIQIKDAAELIHQRVQGLGAVADALVQLSHSLGDVASETPPADDK